MSIALLITSTSEEERHKEEQKKKKKKKKFIKRYFLTRVKLDELYKYLMTKTTLAIL